MSGEHKFYGSKGEVEMKKVLVLLVASFIFIAFPVHSENGNYFKSSVEKAKQGFTNLLTGWLEVPFQAVKGYKAGLGEKEKNKLLGGFFGIFRGFVHGIGRTVDGAYEVATFALPNPKNNEGVGVPLDSKYVWQEGKQYSIPNEGIKPIAKKAKRGFINSVFAIIDVPAQTGKGFKEDKPFKGLAKAIVFPLGRFSSGIYDLVTFILPNDAEGYGYALTEKYPWDALQRKTWGSGL
jgi:putative exosortase-associated protein (TIGR04073 family)